MVSDLSLSFKTLGRLSSTGNKYEIGLATIEKKRNLIDEFKR